MRTTFTRGSLVTAALACTAVHAQEEMEYVSNTFANTTLINTQTIETVPRKRSFGFMIQHRFGAVGPDEQAWKQFSGLDLPANIRFSFQWAPFNHMRREGGRSKNGKTWDRGAKWRVLRQTEGNEHAVSLTVLGNVALMTDDFPPVGDNLYFGDGTTPFVYRFEHRLSYNAQAIIGRRFTRWLAVEMAPVLTYRNLVPVNGSNLTAAVAMGARIRTTVKGSVIVECAPILVGRQEGDHREPLAIGYEVATLGHVFQIVLCSSAEIAEQRLYPSPMAPYEDGYLHLGFNIARTLLVKPKAPKP